MSDAELEGVHVPIRSCLLAQTSLLEVEDLSNVLHTITGCHKLSDDIEGTMSV